MPYPLSLAWSNQERVHCNKGTNWIGIRATICDVGQERQRRMAQGVAPPQDLQGPQPTAGRATTMPLLFFPTDLIVVLKNYPPSGHCILIQANSVGYVGAVFLTTAVLPCSARAPQWRYHKCDVSPISTNMFRAHSAAESCRRAFEELKRMTNRSKPDRTNNEC